MGCIALVRCVLVLRCGLAGAVWYPYAGWSTSASACIRIPHQHTSNQSDTTHEITQPISCKLLRMDVLTCETCRALNNEIIKQVTSSWSLFIQLCSLRSISAGEVLYAIYLSLVSRLLYLIQSFAGFQTVNRYVRWASVTVKCDCAYEYWNRKVWWGRLGLWSV